MNPFFKNYLSDMIRVPFTLETADELCALGDRTGGTGADAFRVTIKKVPDKKDLLTSTSLALGEAYMRGDIEVDRDLFEVLNLFLGQIAAFHRNERALKKLVHTSLSKQNQEQEVTAHYDIGNDFYRLWLDDTMSYSCAYFKDAGDAGDAFALQPADRERLTQAQTDKVDHILEKLQLKPGMRLLDIGCGWGFLLARAAEKYDVSGLGITLSVEQHAAFSQLIERRNLKKRLSVRRMDYRELEKSGLVFDRVVSVGMLEHVGRGNYGLFLKNVNAVLADGGLFLLHFISALKEHPGDAWIKKYIFPGGVIPSLREIIDEMAEHNFYTLDVESLRRHYTKTLLSWRKALTEQREKVVKMQGEEFYRMWELYLASCAAAFYNGVIDLHQILMSKGINNGTAMVRNYRI